ncbi:FimD/PapC N-terminal domain-containing protein [Escherichia coli]
MPRFARLTIALGLATAVFPVDAEYYFNPRFLSNDLAESVDLSAFTKGREAPPGTYRVDIYLNDEFMTSRDITFIADDNNAELIPCLSTDLLVSLGIKKIALLDNKEHSAENMCRTTAHAHHFRIVWPTHQLSLMLVSNICHSPFRKFMLAEWLAAMFLLICGKKE